MNFNEKHADAIATRAIAAAEAGMPDIAEGLGLFVIWMVQEHVLQEIRDQIEATDEELDLLAADPKKLPEWIAKTREVGLPRCGFCGWRATPRGLSPVRPMDQLFDHVSACELHPVRRALEENAVLQARVSRIEKSAAALVAFSRRHAIYSPETLAEEQRLLVEDLAAAVDPGGERLGRDPRSEEPLDDASGAQAGQEGAPA